MKKFLDKIQAPTPQWAKSAMLLLNLLFTLAVSLQESQVVDMFPLDNEFKPWAKFIIALFVVVGNGYLASREKES